MRNLRNFCQCLKSNRCRGGWRIIIGFDPFPVRSSSSSGGGGSGSGSGRGRITEISHQQDAILITSPSEEKMGLVTSI